MFYFPTFTTIFFIAVFSLLIGAACVPQKKRSTKLRDHKGRFTKYITRSMTYTELRVSKGLSV